MFGKEQPLSGVCLPTDTGDTFYKGYVRKVRHAFGAGTTDDALIRGPCREGKEADV